MEKKTKILNDPVYGFVSIPYGILFDLVEHPYFQRLRNIKQVSLTHYVYPGALHTRFHHALGALHLMQQAVTSLRGKGVEISDEEAEAVMIAILLHDIGHGPFSHTLEHTLIGVNHEALSLLFMERLNDAFQGRLGLAIEVFTGRYPKPYLHQLVSGQLDMDRLDYLNRDSYFTGVAEGVIGYDRIIKMLNVVDGRLVVEQKGIYSVERFLTSRRIMYWQVYLHKTVVAAEQMLRLILRRARELATRGQTPWAPPALEYFLNHSVGATEFTERRNELLDCFAALDDTDVSAAVKTWQRHPDALLSYLSYGLVNRRLFRLEFSNDPFDPAYVEEIRRAIHASARLPAQAADHLIIQGQETNSAYTLTKEEIMVCTKEGTVVPMSSISDFGIAPRSFTKYFLCYPKEASER
ncbi:HD domain-containing protein [Neolewinella litorea]|uniref:HD domain-containing protein n=1 Tax=Neolewinella litorea TaxID=2562452 RepID=A0A4S4NEB1_9BACT|nr:HD domain-containing protein [Neolewinella litorea]THH36438.1 HD domain-containing protein [Neolewinella litorea]